MRPEVGRSMDAIQNASVLFPEPDSPTSARVLPAKMESETPSTAAAASECAPTVDDLYRFTRESTLTSGSAICMIRDFLSAIFEAGDCMIFVRDYNSGLALSALLHSFGATRLKSASQNS